MKKIQTCWQMHSLATVTLAPPGLFNSLLYGVRLFRKLITAHKAAVCVVKWDRNFEHISSMLQELHSLQCIKFKLMIICKCLHGLAPPNLANNCMSVTARNLPPQPWQVVTPQSADTNYLWTTRQTTDLPTTLPLEAFMQRNYVVNVFQQKNRSQILFAKQ